MASTFDVLEDLVLSRTMAKERVAKAHLELLNAEADLKRIKEQIRKVQNDLMESPSKSVVFEDSSPSKELIANGKVVVGEALGENGSSARSSPALATISVFREEDDDTAREAAQSLAKLATNGWDNNFKSEDSLVKKRSAGEQVDDDAKSQKKGRIFTPLQHSVMEFLEARRETVQRIFKEQVRRQDVLPCEKAEGGYYFVSSKQKTDHQLPVGIQGTKERHGKQNFQVLLHNIMLSGKKVGIHSDDVNFEDPRDCADIIRKLNVEFEKYLKEPRSS